MSSHCMQQVFVNQCTVAPYDVTISSDSTGDVMARPITLHYGNNLVLNCTASGDPDIIFHWIKDKNYLEGNNNILNITDVTASDGGLYECVANNTGGESSINITIYGRFCLSLNQ